jgi:hypothetical protein
MSSGAFARGHQKTLESTRLGRIRNLRYGRHSASLARFSDLCAGHGGPLCVQYGEPSEQQLVRRGVPCAQLFVPGDAFGVQNGVLAVVLPSSVFLILPSSISFLSFLP